MDNKETIFTLKQLSILNFKEVETLYNLLLKIEDFENHKDKKISNTINIIQEYFIK